VIQATGTKPNSNPQPNIEVAETSG
jgi:hypothetical protein